VVSSKKKSTVMSPIRRQMKKRNPSGGQNGQLVHWWVLIHSGRFPRHSNPLSLGEKPSLLQAPPPFIGAPWLELSHPFFPWGDLVEYFNFPCPLGNQVVGLNFWGIVSLPRQMGDFRRKLGLQSPFLPHKATWLDISNLFLL
jgi:hypothetical protein